MTTKLETESYRAQQKRWPGTGKHILAQYDDDHVIVYQAYRPSIGNAAVKNQKFLDGDAGGGFSYTRMTWVKPNFLWMMYRAGWASKQGQEVILALTLKRDAFEHMLAVAVPTTYHPDDGEKYGNRFEDKVAWRKALDDGIRMQWDPDHGPHGDKKQRRAIQLGIPRHMSKQFATEWIVSIEDVTAFVHEQANILKADDGKDRLVTPRETIFIPSNATTALHLGIDTFAAGSDPTEDMVDSNRRKKEVQRTEE